MGDGIEIHLQRNRIVILGYTLPKKGTKGWLPNVFCVFDTKTTRYIDDKRYSYQDPNSKEICVPRTADVGKIVSRINSSNLLLDGIFDDSNADVVEYRELSSPITIKEGLHPKNEFQVRAVEFLKQPLGHNMHFRLLSLPTGEGKTFCALNAVAYYNRKVIIVADSLVDQWVSEILDKLTISYKKIYEIKGIDSVKDLMTKEIHPSRYDIYVASLRTLLNAQEAGLYEPMVRKLGIGLYIVDEFHIQTYSHWFMCMCAPIAEFIFLSATPARSNPSEDYVFKMVNKELPSYGEEVGELREKYLHVIYINYDSKPDWQVVARCNTFYGFQTSRFADHIFSPKVRDIIFDILKYVIDLTVKYVDEDEKIVILFERLDHVKLTIGVLRNLYPGIPIGDYTSNAKGDKKTENLKNKIILSTNESFGTGSDLKGKLRVLVNTTTYNSKVTAKQQPGRIRPIPGKSVYYIDLVNLGFKRTVDHFINRSKVINGYAAKVEKRVYGVDI